MHLVGSFVPLLSVASFMADIGMPGAITILKLLMPTSSGVGNILPCFQSACRLEFCCLFFSVHCEDLLGQWLATLTASHALEFPIFNLKTRPMNR